MSELLEDSKVEETKYIGESDSDSDVDSLDSEGYNPKDPYSAMARKIDKRNQVVADYHRRPSTRATKMIIENKENMTYFEKHIMKYIVCFGLLGMLIYTNLSNPVEVNESRSKKY